MYVSTLAVEEMGTLAASYEDFVVLMSRHQRQIWWFISTLLPMGNDADDVLQETSLVLWRKWEQFDPDRDFVSWSFGIARLQVLKHVRENRSSRLYLNEVVLGEIATAAERHALDLARTETRLDALRGCVRELDESHRDVIEARYLDSCSTKEIARRKGMPLATVYTLLRRARAKLTECVDRKLAIMEHGV